jgi:tetratricopeptide (TPR) repeat protein
VLVKWLEQNPNDVAVRMHLADQRYLAGQYHEAITHYETIGKADPNLALAWNNLASAYLQLKDPRALATAEADLKLNADDANVLDTLGVAQTRHGKSDAAVDTLKKGLARRADSAEIRGHYALALAKAGDRAAARTELQHLVNSGRAANICAEAEALLAER